jgi:Mechanosensitive ion channel, conserved TM helix
MIDTITTQFNAAIGGLIAALPSIIGALILLIIGWIIAGIVARIVTTVLERVGADRLFAQHGAQVYGSRTQSFTISKVVGEVVKWLIRLVFLVAAANLLGLTQISLLLNQIILWLPNLLVAAIILLIAPLIGRFVRGAIEVGAGQMGFTNAGLLGRVAEIAIIVFAVIIAINQIGIAANLVNTLFIGLVAALALAFGLAFGLGGRSVAEQLWNDWYQSSQQAAERVKTAAQQQQQQQPGGRTTLRTEDRTAYGEPAGGTMPSGAQPR